MTGARVSDNSVPFVPHAAGRIYCLRMPYLMALPCDTDHNWPSEVSNRQEQTDVIEYHVANVA